MLSPNGHSRRFLLLLLLTVLIGSVLSQPVQAADVFHRSSEFRLGSDPAHPIFGGGFKGGASVSAGDLDNDGFDEIVVGAGSGGGPHIEIYTPTGIRLSSWFAFKQSMRSGVSVAAGDLDSDGIAEIVVGPRGNYAPEIQIYNPLGQRLRSFLAFEPTYTGGIEVAILRAEDAKPGLILVTSGSGREQEVRAFTMNGHEEFRNWYPHGKTIGNSLGIAAMWSTTFQEPVLVTGAGEGQPPLVLVHGLRTGRLLASWLAYDRRVTTGLSIGAFADRIVTGPGRKGGPDVRVFTVRGRQQQSSFAFESNFRGGVEVAYTTNHEVVATPLGKPDGVYWAPPTSKKIVVDLSDQRIYLYEGGRLISIRIVSTGKASTPTPTGNFQTRNKITTAYSTPYNLYMEYWMAFSGDGAYGLHSLPYWKLSGGGRYYEGASHLGTPVSHGCIRQSLADAKSLFEWAPIGTPVVVQP